MSKKYVIDTNILLSHIEVLEQYDNILIPIVVLEELDKIKTGMTELGYKARQALKKLEDAVNVTYEVKDKYDTVIVGWDSSKPDNKIIFCALENKATLISNDLNVIVKAKSLGMETIRMSKVVDDEYTGYLVLEEDEEIAEWYSTKGESFLHKVLENQFVLVKDTEANRVTDCFVKSEGEFYQIDHATLNSSYLGEFSPKDLYQRVALHSLINNQMTMLKGGAGTGKSLLALSYALHAIEKGSKSSGEGKKIDKLVIFCNTVAVKNAAKLGYYAGSKEEKLMDSQIGNMLISKLGGLQAVQSLIKTEKLVVLPMSDIRGYDTTGMRAIVWITEAQNLDIELIRLAIQRVGEDSQLIIDGDYSTQVDCTSYEGANNGMRRVSEVFRGEDCYGEVELKHIYRSKLAEIADKL